MTHAMRRVAAMFAAGLASSTTRSATLPAATWPSESARSSSAPFRVAAVSASTGAQQLGTLPRRGRERLDRRQAGGDEQAQLFVQREARYEQLIRGVGAGRDEPARALELADELVLTNTRSPERLEFGAAPPRATQKPRDMAQARGAGRNVLHARARAACRGL